MHKYSHLLLCLLLLTMPLMAGADNYYEDLRELDIEDESLHVFLEGYLDVVRPEYAYYAHSDDDGSYFPAEREEIILQNIENKFFKRSAEISLFGSAARPKEANLLYYAASTPIAQLLLRYGADPFDVIERTPKTSQLSAHDRFVAVKQTLPLIGATIQTDRRTYRFEKIRGMEEHKILIFDQYEYGAQRRYGSDLPTNNAIALAKLYLALGVDIHATVTLEKLDVKEKFHAEEGLDAVKASLFEINHQFMDDGYKKIDVKHRADDLIQPYVTAYDSDVHFYRSPVTYWLEEFIKAGHPVSMLDTHKLHYPRFMKEASVAEVMDMLNNSDAHKISANINCPYQRKQGAGDEVAQAVSPAELCPLTPSVNMRDAMGRTPLHIAGEQGNKAVFNALINIGADESIKDYRGNLPKI